MDGTIAKDFNLLITCFLCAIVFIKFNQNVLLNKLEKIRFKSHLHLEISKITEAVNRDYFFFFVLINQTANDPLASLAGLQFRLISLMFGDIQTLQG